MTFLGKHSLHGRLSRGLGAQTFSQIVQIIIRLAEVPLLMAFWGPRLYGEWLMLSAIPAYLRIGDGGFSTAACREMIMRAGVGDREGTVAVFQSTWILLLLLSGVVVLIGAVFINTVPLANLLGFRIISPAELKMVLFLLLAYVLIGFQSGLLNGGFWVSGRYPLGMVLTATMQLLEFGGLAVAVVFGGGPVGAALGYMGGRLLGTIILWIYQRKVAPWLQYGLRHATLKELRKLAAPAFASLAFPLGNALNIEGMRLVVGLAIGPTAVAIFTPLRTLSRIAMQPRVVINRLIEPEMALAFGTHDDNLFRRIFLRSCQIAFWISLTASILMVFVGGLILPIWTVGKITMHWPLFFLLLAAVVLNGLWYTALMVAYSTNRHGRTAVVYILIYGGLAFGLGFIGAKNMQLSGVGIALVTVEGMMTIYVIREALRLSDMQLMTWLKIVVRPPLFLMQRGMVLVHGALTKNSSTQKIR